MIKDDYKTFQQMLNFWVVQTDNNIKNDGLKVTSPKRIMGKSIFEAEKNYGNPKFYADYLDYSNFSVQINFIQNGRYEGERVNFVLWENESDVSWFLNLVYSRTQQTIRVCYRKNIESNSDSKEFKDYMTQHGYDQGKSYSLKELSLNSDEPSEKVIDLFNYFEKMITDAKKFSVATNYKNDCSNILLKSKNVIFHGAPGTGKTYLAQKVATDIVSKGKTEDYCDLSDDQKNQIEFVQFHPSYDYTDFVEGLRPVLKDGEMGFELQDGIFKKFCKQAEVIDSEIRKKFDKSWESYLDHIQGLNDEDEYIDEDHYVKINAKKNLNLINKNNEKPAGTLVKESVYQLYRNPEKVITKYRREFALEIVGRLKEKFGLPDVYESINQKNFYEAWENLISYLRSPNNEKTYITKTSYIEANSNDNLSIKYDSEGQGYSIKKEVIYSYYKDYNYKTTKVTPSDGRKIISLLKNKFELSDYLESTPLRIDQKDKYVFIIDEINRGEISKIFGELFFSVDPSYRGEKGEVSTQYVNLHDNPEKKFFIPENVYIIGTMNDIDRSVDSFDFAMRRRFRFINIKAEDTIDMLEELPNKEIAIAKMQALNKAIEKVDELNENYHIGASYFLKLMEVEFSELWSDYLEPLLQDYVKGMPNETELLKEFKKAYDLVDGDVNDALKD